MDKNYNALAQYGRFKNLPLCKYEPNNDKFYTWHLNDRTIRAIFGGNRTGKTEAGGFEDVCAVLGSSIEKYIPYMRPQAQELARKWVNNGGSGWVASVSYKLQPDGVQEKIMRYLPEEEIKSISYLSKVENIISQINLKNGNNISFKSYEQGSKDFQSAGKKWIHFDEEPPKDIWKECSVRTTAGITLYRWLTMTPVQGMTWVFDEIYLNKMNNPDIFKIQVGWDDNPHLTQEQIRQMSAGLNEDELQVRREGKFVKRQGLVYKLFNQTTHTVPYNWEPETNRYTFYRSFDFGFAQDHPFVALFFAVDTDGTVYCYDEIYLRETGQEETINRIKEKSQPFSFRTSWGDSARPDWIDYFNKNGIYTELANKDKIAGISKVTEFFTVHPVSKKPRLFISERCKELIEELEKYAYPKADSEGYGKQEPEKKWDNGPDSLRYFLFTFTHTEEKPLTIIGYEDGLGGSRIPIYGGL